MDWNSFDRGVFVVNVLGIVYDKKSKKILIGLRQDDPYIPSLSWSLPGGRPAYVEDLEHYLKLEIKKKTNLNAKIIKVIHARTHEANRKILNIYYYCEASGKARASEKFTEIKWISPTEIQKYFSKSAGKTPKEVYDFLKGLK